jgi:hypothetical protein
MISALVTAGVDAGYLVNSRLAKVTGKPATAPFPHLPSPWQRGGPVGGSPAEIPSDDDARAGLRALAGAWRRQGLVVEAMVVGVDSAHDAPADLAQLPGLGLGQGVED